MIGTNDLGAARCLGEEKAILDAAPGTAERFVVHFFCVYAHSPAHSPECARRQNCCTAVARHNIWTQNDSRSPSEQMLCRMTVTQALSLMQMWDKGFSPILLFNP